MTQGEGLWMIKISKISLQQNSNLIKFKKSAKFFHKIPELCFDVYNEIAHN